MSSKDLYLINSLSKQELLIQNKMKGMNHSLKLNKVFESDQGKDYEDLAKINPDLIDFDVASSSHVGCEIDIARATVDNFFLPNDEFYEMCCQLFVILQEENAMIMHKRNLYILVVG